MARRHLSVLSLLLASSTLVGAAMAEPLIIPDPAIGNDRLEPGLYPSPPVPDGFEIPPEPAHPPVELDWSVGLKGSYTASTEGNAFVTTLNPAFTATHQGVRTDLVLDGNAELARATDGTLAASALRLKLDGTTLLDRDTTLTGTAGLALTQDLVGMPGLNPSVVVPPQVLKGNLDGGVDRRFGQFNIGLKGNLERTLYGTTTRLDTGVTDNASQNVWEGDATLRLGLQATPIIGVFGEAALGRDWFDQADLAGIKPDATSTALRAGVTGSWNGVLAASASVGVGQHDFDDGGLADITTRLFDASITYAPDTTLNLTASLATTVEPTGSDTGGTARVAHTAKADLSYTVNSWLRLRASADWTEAYIEGSRETERRQGVGAGADYKLNSRAALSADYGFAHRDNSTTGLFDSHTISLGVTVRR